MPESSEMTGSDQINSDPASQKKQERRRELIDAALMVFDRDGFSAAKMEDVAAAAGMAKGTVYLYADSKVALFQDVIREKIYPVLIEVEAIFKTHEGSSVDLLRNQIRRFSFEVLNPDRQKVMRLIITEGKQFPEIANFYAESVVQRGMDALRATLSRGMERDEFRQMPLEQLPFSLLGGIILPNVWRVLHGQEFSQRPDHMIDQHLDIFLNGLLK
mgnify:CR=1 FL=1